MADLMPKLKVTDPHTRAGSAQDRRDTAKHVNKAEGKCEMYPVSPMLTLKPVVTNGKLVANLRSPTSPTHSDEVHNGDGSEDTGTPEAAIDPLSQVCISRELCKAHYEADRATCSKYSGERTHLPPYKSCGLRTQTRTQRVHKRRSTMHLRTRSTAGKLRAT